MQRIRGDIEYVSRLPPPPTRQNLALEATQMLACAADQDRDGVLDAVHQGDHRRRVPKEPLGGSVHEGATIAVATLPAAPAALPRPCGGAVPARAAPRGCCPVLPVDMRRGRNPWGVLPLSLIPGGARQAHRPREPHRVPTRQVGRQQEPCCSRRASCRNDPRQHRRRSGPATQGLSHQAGQEDSMPQKVCFEGHRSCQGLSLASGHRGQQYTSPWQWGIEGVQR